MPQRALKWLVQKSSIEGGILQSGEVLAKCLPKFLTIRIALIR